MNKLDRFRFGKSHRRRMEIIGFTTLGIFVVGLSLLAVIGVFGSRSENVHIKLDEQSTAVINEGAGINLNSIPSSNRLKNYDFENSLNSYSFTVLGADSSYLYFETDSGIATSDIVSGDNVDVYSLDSNGVMSLLFTGSVDGINLSRFGMNNVINDSDALWLNDPLVATAASDNVVDALTESGKLIVDIAGEYSVPFDDDQRFVSLCSSNTTVYALNEDGVVYMSADGRSFSALLELPLGDDVAKTIAASGSSLAVLTTNGKLWNISNGRCTELPMNCSDEARLISDGNRVVLCSGDTVYVSSNCYYFSRLAEISTLVSSRNFISVAAGGKNVYLLNSAGQLLTIPDEGECTVADIADIIPTMIVCSSDDDVVALGEDKHAYLISENSVCIDLTSGSNVVDYLLPGANGKIITRSGNNLYMDRVLTGLQIVETLPADTVMSGDICVISSSSSSISSNWEVYGEDTHISTTSDGNDRCLVMSGKEDGVHAVSQLLRGSTADNFAANSFYRIELNVKGKAEGNLKVWVQGDKMTEGAEFAVDTKKNDKLTYVFAVTESMLSDEDSVRFNISFEGEGQIYIDDVYLGEDKYQISDIPVSFAETIKQSNPSVIRLEGLNFCSNGFTPNHFYGMYPDSLENSMRLIRDANACPWIVVGSNASQKEVNNLLSYLCGSVSSEYGKLRTDNGTALPWNRQFDRIYIEIDDDLGAYCSDVQRGAYVTYVMSLFRQSDNYVDIRDKIIFIDGMHYDGSIVMSSADYHAMSLGIDFTNEEYKDMEYLQVLNSVYTEFNYDVPRITSHGAGGGEFVSSLSYTKSDEYRLNAARLASIYLNGDTDYLKMCMFDIAISDRPVDTESEAIFTDASTPVLLNMISKLSFLKNTECIFFEVLDPLDAASEDSAENFMNACTVTYTADRENRYLVVANASNSQQQFITEGVDLISDKATIIRYSSTGEVLFDRAVKRTDLRYTLQPGELIVFTIPNE
ncbi:MAG: hypothetical protein MJ108_10475 [Saccharofermentans sp.]|nr:hypothetical protein [Saccharofermentans sp.]